MSIAEQLTKTSIQQRHRVIRELLEQGIPETTLASAICETEGGLLHAHLTEIVNQLQNADASTQPILASQLLRFRAFFVEWLQTVETKQDNQILSKLANEISDLSRASPQFELESVENVQLLSSDVFEHLHTLAYPVCGTEPFPLETSQDRVLGLIEIEADAMLRAQSWLRSLGPGYVSILHKCLSDSDPLLRRACVWMFSSFESGDVVSSLRSALVDDDVFVRGAAALIIKNASIG